MSKSKLVIDPKGELAFFPSFSTWKGSNPVVFDPFAVIDPASGPAAPVDEQEPEE